MSSPEEERDRQILSVRRQLAEVQTRPDPDAYEKSYSWEVTLKDLTTGAQFAVLVVADTFEEAGDTGVWAAATEKEQTLENYLVLGVQRQRRIAY